jgi:ADP-ribosylglycohydrolase
MSRLTFEDRSIGAFIGLAVGDAYGRELEFVRGEPVRSMAVTVETGTFRWTDDTAMAVYLGKAVLDTADAAFNGYAFGQAVGRRFVEWLRDPLTPSTAPGGTCLRGAEAFERTQDWHVSGDPGSDGCGACMRIVGLPMAFDGETLTTAAAISSMVTHQHPNALESAITACQLLRWRLEGAALDEALVLRAIHELHGSWGRGGTVARSLEDALLLGRRREDRWLDDRAVHPGDGGWRSGSALGLAVAAALAWGDQPMVAIDRAARIDGDSDSVACLAGMFIGAARGVAAFPADMVSLLPERERIEDLARRLSSLGRPR